ncbi:MAG: TrkA family potassium uptake protein [Gammaproteobacteria bacterium]|nr:TrkA family potassium uptake protein [Gammaproteobacteria bacterium]
MPKTYNRFLVLAGVLMLMLLILTTLYLVGMHYLEDKPRDFWQALQWAAGTASTTGYGGDISWHNPLMVVFVVCAQFVGVIMLFLVFPIYLIPVLEARFETKLPTDAVKTRDHVVLFDYGPAVATLLTELDQARIKTVVIEEHVADARHLLEQGRTLIHGALEDGVLRKANLLHARALIVNSSDERNAATILAARQLGYQGEILALVEDPFHLEPMILAGANDAYTPRHVLGAALAARASQRVNPTVTGLSHLGHRLQVAEVRITRDSELRGKTLHEANLRQHVGVTVIGQWVGGKLVSPPTPDMRLEAGGILILVGSDEGIRNFMTLCAGTRRVQRHGSFLICGGGEVGQKVAQLLREAGEQTFIIDSRPVPGVDLVGNVLDTKLLKEAGVEYVHAVILALSADATTLFSTVIVKDLAPDVPVIARVNHAENVERIYAAGADFALSISQVSGQLLALRLLGHQSVAVDPELSVVAVSTHGIAGHHPKDHHIREKTGCTVVAVERGEELLVEFGEDFHFEPADTVYVCGSDSGIQRYYELYPQPRERVIGGAVPALPSSPERSVV